MLLVQLLGSSYNVQEISLSDNTKANRQSFLPFIPRLAYYSVLVEPWAVLPIELLHGVTFGCGWTAGTVHAGRIAPPGMAATMQVSARRFTLRLRFGLAVKRLLPPSDSFRVYGCEAFP